MIEQYKQEATKVYENEERVRLTFRPAPESTEKIKSDLMNLDDVGLVMESLSKNKGVLQYKIVAVFR